MHIIPELTQKAKLLWLPRRRRVWIRRRAACSWSISWRNNPGADPTSPYGFHVNTSGRCRLLSLLKKVERQHFPFVLRTIFFYLFIFFTFLHRMRTGWLYLRNCSCFCLSLWVLAALLPIIFIVAVRHRIVSLRPHLSPSVLGNKKEVSCLCDNADNCYPPSDYLFKKWQLAEW